MGLAKLLGLNVGEQIAQPITAIGNMFDELLTSDEEKLAGKAVLAKIAQHPDIVNGEINKVEAQHRTTFVAGWRPYIGWVCGTSLALYYIPQFIVANIIWIKLCMATNSVVGFPIAEINGLTQLVYAMLGLGTLRTVDKLCGKAK